MRFYEGPKRQPYLLLKDTKAKCKPISGKGRDTAAEKKRQLVDLMAEMI